VLAEDSALHVPCGFLVHAAGDSADGEQVDTGGAWL
jgi:hypothetical protein